MVVCPVCGTPAAASYRSCICGRMVVDERHVDFSSDPPTMAFFVRRAAPGVVAIVTQLRGRCHWDVRTRLDPDEVTPFLGEMVAEAVRIYAIRKVMHS